MATSLAAAALACGGMIFLAPRDHFAAAALIAAVVMSLGVLVKWPGAALCAVVTTALAVGVGRDVPHLGLTALVSIACGVMLRRGGRPEIAAGLAFVTTLLGHFPELYAVDTGIRLIAGAGAQAGASVAIAAAVLMLVPRRAAHWPAHCRVRWDHIVFVFFFGTVATTAVVTAARQSAGATCALLLAALIGQGALRIVIGRAMAIPRERRRKAPHGLIPAEMLRVFLGTTRALGRLQRATARLSQALQKTQAENARCAHELQGVQKTLNERLAQLRQVTHAHAHARGRYQALLNHARDVTLFADANGTIQCASRSVQPIIGFQPAELVGKPLKTLIPPDHILEHPLDLGCRTSAADIAAGLDTVVRTASGENKDALVHVHAFSVGPAVNYAVQLRAPDDIKEALATLERARTLTQAAHRSRDFFIATMSHELRTPLHGLIATLDMMRADENLPPHFEQRLAVARLSARALLRVANDVLDLTRIDSGHIPLEQRPFSLATVLDDVVDESRARADSLGLKIEQHIAQALPPAFIGDPARLRQVLGNLVSNALQCTQAGSVTLNLGFDGTECTIDVIDTGGGIPRDKWQSIFDPFVQVESTRRVGGTGLGLPISRRLVEAMGGTLVLVRSDDTGSTFRLTVSLPVSSEPPPDEQSLRIFNNPHGRVLVVEDNAANRYVAEALLTSLECPTTLVDGGEEALELLAREEFDLVLMDCQMPGLDGYETTRRVRRAVAKRIPIVAMTANAMADHRKLCLEAGMDDFLSKPFGRQALHAILCKWLAPSTNTRVSGEVVTKLASLPALDSSVFEELRESLQWRLGPLHNIRTTFASSARNTLALLDSNAPVVADRRAVRRQLHTLLGSAGMVGARQVEYIARKLQTDIDAHSREAVDADLVLLKDAVRSFEIEFDRRLESSADERDWTGRMRHRVPRSK